MTEAIETHEGTVSKVWLYTLEDGDTLTCFTVDGAPGVFWGGEDWKRLLDEVIELRTRVRVQASIPEPERCVDALCGDGCCEDINCTNVPVNERKRPSLVRADTIEWL